MAGKRVVTGKRGAGGRLHDEEMRNELKAQDCNAGAVCSCSKRPLANNYEYVDSTFNLNDMDRLVRLSEVLDIIPVGKSTWWAGVKSGRFPAPVKNLGPRITAWTLSSIMHLVNGGN